MTQAPEGAVQSSYLGGKLTLWQPAKGYRAAIDPALLAASVSLKPGRLAVEFGCGVGAALLSVASLNPGARLLGLEQDLSAAELADKNAAINDFADRVAVRNADVMDFKGGGGDQDEVKPDPRVETPAQIDAIFFNPPFFDDPSTLRAPDPSRTKAWINYSSLTAWIELALRRLKEGGRLTVIQRADRLDDMLAALRPKAGDITILPVHPKADAPAKRIIVAATKTSRAPLQVLPGLVLHRADGAYTREADAILRGEARTALAHR